MNLVHVCPTCHQKLERLYSENFYKRLGLDDVRPTYKETAPIEDIEDISEHDCEQLREAEIKTISELETADPKGVASTTSLSETEVRDAIKLALEQRGPPVTAIEDISETDAAELDIMGIKFLPQLASTDTALVAQVTEISEAQVETWAERAREKMY